MELLDPRKIKENLQGKIKSEFINLIPQEAFDKLIEEATAEVMADMKKVAKEEILKEFKQAFSSQINELTRTVWNSEKNQQEVNKTLIKLMEEAAPGMLANILSMQAGSVMSQVIYQLNNNQHIY